MQKALKKSGLNNTEALVYLEVMRLGKATPALISQVTGIKRSTVYSTAKELIKKGVILGDFGGKYMSLVALPPGELMHLLEKKKDALDREEKSLKEVIEQLSQLNIGSSADIPKIRFVEEHEIQDFLYSRVDVWNESAQNTDMHYWGFQDTTFVSYYKKWITDWFSFKSAAGIVVNLLSDNDFGEDIVVPKKSLKKRNIRSLKKDINFSSTLWVAGDYFITINTQKSPFFLIEIENELLAENMRKMFKVLWEEGK